MNTVEVTVTGRDQAIERVSGIKARVGSAQQRIATESARMMTDSLRSEAPVGATGNLRDRIGYRTRLALDEIQIHFHGAPHTHLVTGGTKEHDIWAGFYTGKSDKRFLFFEGSGVAHVHHPGSTPNNFVKRGFYATIGPIRELIRASGAAVLGQ